MGMTTREYAEAELKNLGMLNSDSEFDHYLCKNILEICDVFDKQNHSGASAAYIINILVRVLNYLPLLPLTGEDEEWDMSQGYPYQNKRCFHIFKKADGRAYDSKAKMFSEDGESWCLTAESKEEVTFPYTVPTEPKRVIRKK